MPRRADGLYLSGRGFCFFREGYLWIARAYYVKKNAI